MQNLTKDARFALRSLRKRPGFAVAAVLTLALGIGANTSLFSVVNGLLLRPLPVKDPHSLVALVLFDRDGEYARQQITFPLYREYAAEAAGSFSELFACASTHTRINNAGRLRPGRVHVVSGNFFEALGVRPQLGRSFAASEDAAPMRDPVAVISHEMWKGQFQGDPNVVGRTVVLDDHWGKNLSVTVIGVAPKGFRGLEQTGPDLWAPSMLHGHFIKAGPVNFRLVGRLRPGVSRQAATLAVQRATDAIGEKYGGRPVAGYEADGAIERPLRAQLRPAGRGAWGPFRSAETVWKTAGLFLAAVGMVLLIGCANIANLMLVRSVQRRREFAVRLSLGAGRAQLLRQVLVESVVLALIGGAAGLVVARWGNEALVLLRPSLLSGHVDLSTDWRVIAFAMGLSVLTGLLFGAVPALHATRLDPNTVLKEGAAGATQGRSGGGRALAWLAPREALVVTQVAVCVALLLGAGLCLRSFVKLNAIDLGFDANHVVSVPVDVGTAAYSAETAAPFWTELFGRLERLPGVRSVSFAVVPPFTGSMIRPAGPPEGYVPAAGEETNLDFNIVGPRYFETMGTPYVRAPATGPRPGEFQFLVNESFARRYWPGRDPVGLSVDNNVVAGVVKDSRLKSLWEEPAPHAYHVQSAPIGTFGHLLVRTDGEAARAVPAIRQELLAVNKDLDPSRIRTMRTIVDQSLTDERLSLALLGAFASAALALAAVGAYGVTSFAVAARTRELGIRTALGALPANLHALVMRQAMLPVICGIALGLAASLALARLVSGLLYGVSAGDPATIVGVIAVLSGVAGVACAVPAFRATRVDPMVALRHE